eukprot:Rmarinus@m.6551
MKALILLVLALLHIVWSYDGSIEVFYKFDDGSGTIVEDSSGRDEDGTFGGSGHTWHSTGCARGGCLEFTSAGWVDMPTNSVDDIESGEVSVLFWWRGSEASTEQVYVFSVYGTGADHYRDSVVRTYFWDDNRYRFSVGDGTGDVDCAEDITVASYKHRKWHHVALTFDDDNAGDFRLYLDGELLRSTGCGENLDDVASVRINGRPYDGSRKGNFRIDDFRVYSSQLSQSNIREVIDYARQLRLHYEFDGNYLDSSGNDFDGSASGTLSFLSTGDDCPFYGCLNFGGSGNVVVPFDSFGTTLATGGVTIAYWAKGLTSVNYYMVDARYVPGDDVCYRLRVFSTDDLYWETGYDASYTAEDHRYLSLAAGEFQSGWRHWAFVRDFRNQESHMYLDGILIDSKTGFTEKGRLPTNVAIGSRYNGIDPWTGYMDDFRMYNYPMDTSTIWSEIIPAPTLRLHLSFDEGSGQPQDSSGYDFHGTMAGTAAWDSGTNCYAGGACMYFGSSGEVSFHPVALATLRVHQAITVMFWAKSDPGYTPGSATAFQVEDNLGLVLAAIDFPWGGTDIIFDAGQGTTDRITRAVPSGAYEPIWHHYTFSKDATSGDMKMYIDAVLVQSATAKTTKFLSSQTAASIGRNTGDGNPWAGWMENFKIFDYALSDDDVTTECDCGGKLRLHYAFDESSGHPQDSSGFGFHGTISGSHTWQPTGCFTTSCLEFISAKVVVPPEALDSIPRRQEITVTFWSKGDSALTTSYDTNIFDARNSGAVIALCDYALSNNIDFQTGDGGSTEKISLAATNYMVKDAWHHWAMTKNAITGDVAIYMDGEVMVTGTGHTKQMKEVDIFYVAKQTDETDQWLGKMAHFKVYDYALSQAEVYDDLQVGHIPSLRLHYIFDETTGAPQDSSGYGFHGTRAGAAPWVTTGCYSSNCISFGGGEVSVPSGALSTLYYRQEITITFWARGLPTYLPADACIMHAEDASNNLVFKVHLPFGDETFRFHAGYDGNKDVITYSVQDEYYELAWHHYAFVKDVGLGEMKIYVDGALLMTGTGNTRRFNHATGFTIARDMTDNQPWKGHLENFKIFDYAMSDDEVATDCNCAVSGSLRLHYAFDETSGNPQDSSGNSFHGTLSGTTTWETTGCLTSNCLKLDGGYIDVPAEALATVPRRQELTITYWAKGDSAYLLADTRLMEAMTLNDEVVIRLEQPWGDTLFWLELGELSSSKDTLSFSMTSFQYEDIWHHWAIRKDVANGDMEVFWNGVSFSQLSGKTIPFKTPNIFHIGQSTSGSNQWKGMLDELKIYDYLLSDDEIRAEFNSGPPPPMLRLWYKFDETSGEPQDSSGFNFHGTLSGTTSWITTAAGCYGANCISFDGGEVTVPPESMLSLVGRQEVTVLLWSKGDPDFLPRDYPKVFDARNSDNRRVISAGHPQTYTEVWRAGSASNEDSLSYDVTDEEAMLSWHHWAYTKDVAAGEMKLYIDGVAVDTDTGKTRPLTEVTDFLIADQTSGGTWKGMLENFKVYDYVLTPAEIVAECNCAVPAGSLRLHYAFDETSGNPQDSSGNSFHGTLSGTTTWETTGCLTSNCLKLDGGYVDVPAEALATIPRRGEVTIMFWSYGEPTYMPANTRIFDAETYNGEVVFRLELPWSNEEFWLELGVESGGRDTLSYFLRESDYEGNWHHWAVRKDVATGTMDAFWNGVCVKTETGKIKPFKTVDSFRIGATVGNTEQWKGMLEEFKIYDYLRTDAEIMNEYLAGPPPPILRLWYKFDETSGEPQDSSGFNFHGTLSGTTNWITSSCYSTNCLEFGGGKIDVPVNSLITLPIHDEVTVMFWSKGDPSFLPTAGAAAFEAEDSSSNRVIYLAHADTSTETWKAGYSGGTNQMTHTVRDEEYELSWHHWAFT